MIDRLGSGVSAATLVEIFRIGTQAVREKIGSLKLHTVEDANAFLPALIPAMSRFFHVPMEELIPKMVKVQPMTKVIEKVAEKNPIFGTILSISSMFGGSEVPPMSYSPHSNTMN